MRVHDKSLPNAATRADVCYWHKITPAAHFLISIPRNNRGLSLMAPKALSSAPQIEQINSTTRAAVVCWHLSPESPHDAMSEHQSNNERMKWLLLRWKVLEYFCSVTRVTRLCWLTNLLKFKDASRKWQVWLGRAQKSVTQAWVWDDIDKGDKIHRWWPMRAAKVICNQSEPIEICPMGSRRLPMITDFSQWIRKLIMGS